MVQGVIIKALSGFYYVAAGDQIVECKARGRFRYDGCSRAVYLCTTLDFPLC